MNWRPIPRAEGYEISEAGEVRRPDGPLVPHYRLLWGGRRVVMSAETPYRMTFNRPFPACSSSAGLDEERLDATQHLAEKLRRENDELRARFAAFGIDI